MSTDLYYVNKNAQENGDHEVHTISCSHCADAENRIYLGSFDNCKDALKEAESHFDQVDGCFYCTNECHQS